MTHPSASTRSDVICPHLGTFLSSGLRYSMHRTRSAVTISAAGCVETPENTNVEIRPVRAEFFSSHRWTRTYELHREPRNMLPTNPRVFTARGNLFASISVVKVLDPSADPFRHPRGGAGAGGVPVAHPLA